jgi:rod shape-determining protein MreB
MSFARREHQLAIGQQAAEDVKLEIGSAWPLDEELETEIRGRDLVTGLPKAVTLGSEEVRRALEEPLSAIIEAVKGTLEQTPPELAADIAQRGLMLAGGGALLKGFDERLRSETLMPAYLAESPLTCVAEGAGRSLDEFRMLNRGGPRKPRGRRARDRSGPTVISRLG